jgi:hypothetical protein
MCRLNELWMFLVIGAIGCGTRTGLEGDRDADSDVPDDVSPIGLSASFHVSMATDGQPARTTANGVIWDAAGRRPMPGGGGGRGYVLAPGESVTINGVALQGGFADWGYTYQATGVPVPADGVWEFRFLLRGRTVVRRIELQAVRWVDFPTRPVSIAAGVTLRWTPALPTDTRRQGYLSSCVRNDTTEVGVSAMSFRGALSADPCLSHAIMTAVREVALGAPFGEGNLSVSTGLDRELRVVP